MNQKRCPNCGNDLEFFMREDVQLGRTGWLLGDLPNLFAGAQEMEFWVCPRCRKLELYLPETTSLSAEGMAKVICPSCGVEHELDDPKCPNCGAKNTKLY